MNNYFSELSSNLEHMLKDWISVPEDIISGLVLGALNLVDSNGPMYKPK